MCFDIPRKEHRSRLMWFDIENVESLRFFFFQRKDKQRWIFHLIHLGFVFSSSIKIKYLYFFAFSLVSQNNSYNTWIEQKNRSRNQKWTNCWEKKRSFRLTIYKDCVREKLRISNSIELYSTNCTLPIQCIVFRKKYPLYIYIYINTRSCRFTSLSTEQCHIKMPNDPCVIYTHSKFTHRVCAMRFITLDLARLAEGEKKKTLEIESYIPPMCLYGRKKISESGQVGS